MALLADSRDALPARRARDARVAAPADRAATRPAMAASERLSERRHAGRRRVPRGLPRGPLARALARDRSAGRRQEVDLRNLAQLSQYIVQHLRESILVVDTEDRIRLINESAAQTSRRPRRVSGRAARRGSPQLLIYSNLAQRGDGHGGARADVRRRRRRPRDPAALRAARRRSPSPVIVFLEDTSLIAEKVQQSKLAALGRLSASIAHEIRNPVGAMSHAAQLLGESPCSRRRTAAHRDHSQNARPREPDHRERAGAVAARKTRPERLRLAAWLEDFRASSARRCSSSRERAERRRAAAATSKCSVDPTQLAADRLEPLRQRREVRRRHGTARRGRAPHRAPRLRPPALPRSRRPRPRHRPRSTASGSSSRSSRGNARHGPGPVPRARARADQRRDAAL